MDSVFKAGQVVQHILQKEWVLVLYPKTVDSRVESYMCRTKQFELKEFYPFELESIRKNNNARKT